jgi:hypothetical protein
MVTPVPTVHSKTKKEHKWLEITVKTKWLGLQSS